jgi:anti-sigma factor RsiW
MTRCSETHRIQDYLDGQLERSAEESFRAHLADCDACGAELVRFTAVFGALAAAPTWDPGPSLTERVLDRVLPSRQRRRHWVRAAGWAYAGVVAASLAAFAAWLIHPGTVGQIGALWGAASHQVVRITVFTLDAAAFAALNVANGWSALQTASLHVAPLARALGAVLSPRAIGLSLLPAVLASAVVLWWMRPRGRDSRGMRHVGVLGF